MPSKKVPYKKSYQPIHLGSFGYARQLRFDHGGSVRVVLNGEEIERLTGALQTYVLRRARVPSAKALGALQTLSEYFSTERGHDLAVHVDVPIAVHAVELTPVLLTQRGMKLYEEPFPYQATSVFVREIKPKHDSPGDK